MFDIGWSELLLVGVVALLVVGPKELPRMLRTAGQYVGRARSMARDFQRSVEDAAMEMDVKELNDARRHLSDLKSMKVADLDGIGDIGGGVAKPSTAKPTTAKPSAPSKPAAAAKEASAPAPTPAAEPAPEAAQPEAKDVG